MHFLQFLAARFVKLKRGPVVGVITLEISASGFVFDRNRDGLFG
jgi:hypothetical protein